MVSEMGCQTLPFTPFFKAGRDEYGPPHIVERLTSRTGGLRRSRSPGWIPDGWRQRGDLWISTPQSLFHLRPETAVEEIRWPKLGRKDSTLAMLP